MRFKHLQRYVSFGLIALSWGVSSVADLAAEPRIDVSLTIDFGRDVGQNLGTLFQAVDGGGHAWYGAGFASVYNSYHRGERMKLQFFIRPRDGAEQYAIEPVARPWPDPTAYVFDLQEELLVQNQADKLHQWQETLSRWQALHVEQWPGHSASTVRGKRLEWFKGRLVYDGEAIFTPGPASRYFFYYYAQGHLFFFRLTEKETGDISNHIVAIPWSPYAEDLQVNTTRAKLLISDYPQEYAYSWGQWRNQILCATNMGGLYMFNGNTWERLIEPDGTSSQVYSMITFHDRLLLAHYPTGFLLAYHGAKVRMLEQSPPVPLDASPYSREAQTTMIYRGDLFVGVWPWAELWRYHDVAGTWHSLGRLFSHPNPHEQPLHPYEDEADAIGLEYNALGQRLTSMVPYGTGMVMGTSWKGGYPMLDVNRLSFLTPDERQQYGRLYRLHLSDNLTAVMTWKDVPTTLHFVAENGTMAIYQDGEVLATSQIGREILSDLPATTLVTGQGVFGPLNGFIFPPKRGASSNPSAIVISP